MFRQSTRQRLTDGKETPAPTSGEQSCDDKHRRIDSPGLESASENAEERAPVKPCLAAPSVADICGNEDIDGGTSLKNTRHGSDELVCIGVQRRRISGDIEQFHVN